MSERLPPPFLKFEDGDGREIPLCPGNVWTIGRTEQNAVVLPDDMVSRNHAVIQHLDGDAFQLIDLGSRNGSFVNGHRVTAPVALSDGDRLSFGGARLCFHNPAQVAAAQTPFVPAAPPTHGETVALLKRVDVSVMVVDIRGFTLLAQKIEAGLLSRLVSLWFAGVDRIIHNYGGTAQKHIGDAAMAAWVHATRGNELDEIMRILKAVAEIARFTGDLHQSLGLAEPLRIGAGINTGLAILGNTGAGAASDFTVIGDSVNMAFRLESATRHFGTDLVLGISTFDYLRPWAPASTHFRAAEVNLKGYDAAVNVCHISFSALCELMTQWGHGAR